MTFWTIADGTCVIDILVPADVPGRKETSTWGEITRAARAILTTCVVRPDYHGGYVNSVGTYEVSLSGGEIHDPGRSSIVQPSIRIAEDGLMLPRDCLENQSKDPSRESSSLQSHQSAKL